MIILRALAYTVAIVLIGIALIATVYVSIWLILAVAVVLLFHSFYHVLRAEKHLLDNSSEL